MSEVLIDNRKFISIKSTTGDFLLMAYSEFNCKDVPSEPKVFIGDCWVNVNWYSLKFHYSLPEAWSRIEEETGERL